MLYLFCILIGAGLGVGGKYLVDYIIKLDQERNAVKLDMGEILRWKEAMDKVKKWTKDPNEIKS